jgi:hypothetical protein
VSFEEDALDAAATIKIADGVALLASRSEATIALHSGIYRDHSLGLLDRIVPPSRESPRWAKGGLGWPPAPCSSCCRYELREPVHVRWTRQLQV